MADPAGAQIVHEHSDRHWTDAAGHRRYLANLVKSLLRKFNVAEDLWIERVLAIDIRDADVDDYLTFAEPVSLNKLWLAARYDEYFAL